jgi:hypothetical protein
MPTTPFNFTFYLGADYAYEARVTFTDGSILSSYTASSVLTRGLGGPVAATLVTQILPGGVLTITLPNSVTRTLQPLAYNHYVKLIRGDGFIIPLISGVATGVNL